MAAATGELPGMIVVAPTTPEVDAIGVAGRAAALIDAAAVDHTVHVVVADEHAVDGANVGGMVGVPGAHTTARLDLGPVDRRAPGRQVVAQVASQLGAVDAGAADGVLAIGLDLAPAASSLAEWLGVPFVVDAAGDHQGLLRPERPSVASEPEWYLGVGAAARASLVLLAFEHETALVEQHLGVIGRTAVVGASAPQVAWQVGPPTSSGQVLVRGDFTTPGDLAAARWLLVEVLPLLPEPFTLELVGRAGQEVRNLVNRRPGARVHGPSDDLLDTYHFADVAVAAQRLPGGGAHQVLEAFSHRRGVVATTAAIEGLDLVAGEHVRTSDDADTFAGAIMALARPRTDQAEQLVEAQVAEAAELAATTFHADVARAVGADALSSATGARQGTAA